jgi:hypothetical protein
MAKILVNNFMLFLIISPGYINTIGKSTSDSLPNKFANPILTSVEYIKPIACQP